jgi:hypothetical protein
MATLFWGSVAVHLAAAGLLVARVNESLPAALGASRAAVHAMTLETGLLRFSTLVAFLPPVASSVAGLSVWSLLRRESPDPGRTRWFAVGAVWLAIEGVLRTAHAWQAPPPAYPGAVLQWVVESPVALSAIANDFGVTLPSWSASALGLVTLTDLAAAMCWASAASRVEDTDAPAVTPVRRGLAVLAGQALLVAVVVRFVPAVTQMTLAVIA